MQLTQNFSLLELTRSEVALRKGWDNSPGPDEEVNLKRLAEKLEEVREAVDKPIIINSAYRGLRVNTAVGGSATSQHLRGCAADFIVPGMTVDQVIKIILKAGIEFDQLIREWDNWIHISITNSLDLKPRKQVLIIDAKGTRIYN